MKKNTKNPRLSIFDTFKTKKDELTGEATPKYDDLEQIVQSSLNWELKR